MEKIVIEMTEMEAYTLEAMIQSNLETCFSAKSFTENLKEEMKKYVD